MNIPETYNYLVRARRDLCATLEGVADEVLSRPLLGGARCTVALHQGPCVSHSRRGGLLAARGHFA
jgi:hypothetical protein